MLWFCHWISWFFWHRAATRWSWAAGKHYGPAHTQCQQESEVAQCSGGLCGANSGHRTLWESISHLDISQQEFEGRKCSSCTGLDNWMRVDEVFQKETVEQDMSSQDMILVLFVRSWPLVQRLDFCSCPVPCCHVSSPNYSLYIICSNISFLSCSASVSSCAGWECGSLPKWGLADQGCAEAERDLQIVKCTYQFWYAQEWDNCVSDFWVLHWEPACSSALFLLCHPHGQSPSAAPKTTKFYLWLSWMPMQNKTNTHEPTYLFFSDFLNTSLPFLKQ